MFVEPVKGTYPDLSFPAHSDGWYGANLLSQSALYEIADARYNDPLLKRVLELTYAQKKRLDPEALLNNQTINASDEKMIQQSYSFDASGFCLLRSDARTVVLKFGGEGIGHVAPREMRTLYLEPFRKAFCEAGALGVMSSYNDYDGEPITGSYHFLTEILRQEWGFKGYVVSDSEAVEFLYSKHKVAADAVDGAAQVVNAGLDVRTNFSLPENFILPLRQAITEGKIAMNTVDSRVADVLRVKFLMGLFDTPYKGNAKQSEEVVHSKEHQSVSMKAALESIVLLKNENNILPLSKNLKKVAVIGPNADEVKDLICRYGPANAPIKTVYQGIKEYLPDAEVRYAKGADIIDKHFPESELYDVPLDKEEQAMMDEAVALAKESEVAIMIVIS